MKINELDDKEPLLCCKEYASDRSRSSTYKLYICDKNNVDRNCPGLPVGTEKVNGTLFIN